MILGRDGADLGGGRDRGLVSEGSHQQARESIDEFNSLRIDQEVDSSAIDRIFSGSGRSVACDGNVSKLHAFACRVRAGVLCASAGNAIDDV